MKSYYDKNDCLNERGVEIARRVSRFLRPIYKEEYADEFSVRELTGIIMQEASMCESTEVINKRLRKGKSNNAKTTEDKKE